MTIESIIFGKKCIPGLVSCEVSEGKLHTFTQEAGVIKHSTYQNIYWILATSQLDGNFEQLEGELPFKFIKTYKHEGAYFSDRQRYKEREIYSIHDQKESAMIFRGFTYFRGLKLEDVSVLSFDIETTGLHHDEDSKVLLISNTFYKDGVKTSKLFAYDDYPTSRMFFEAWANWVRDIDPSVIVGHNIFSYDLPYLNYCAKREGVFLKLGRDKSFARFEPYKSKFRKDQTQFIEYNRCHIFGREIVDTMFLAIKYDISKKYESYGLKSIIATEGLEKADRQFYDAAQIRFKYQDAQEWAKIKAYCEHDADDALALYFLMVPSFFYLSQSVPKSFQSIVCSASGSQINSILVRAYLQEGHSLPKASEAVDFEGATSFGRPGVYKNVSKADVSSLYPSIMITYNVFDPIKDPNQVFTQMVKYFTDERLSNKKKAKETNDKYYRDLEQSQKICINSAYGLLGTNGLAFNSPHNAALITQHGREILKKAIDWAEAKGFLIPNGDTDSISYCYPDFRSIEPTERASLLAELNSLYPSGIRWDDDGYYDAVLILKAKNYVLYADGKMKNKGSALKSSTREPAFKEFMNEFIREMLCTDKPNVLRVYEKFVLDIMHLSDIKKYASKKTITKTTLTSERTNEKQIVRATLGQEISIGDKCYVYFDINGQLKTVGNYADDADKGRLLKKLHDCTHTFETVVSMDLFINYSLKKNQKLLQQLVLEEELFA